MAPELPGILPGGRFTPPGAEEVLLRPPPWSPCPPAGGTPGTQLLYRFCWSAGGFLSHQGIVTLKKTFSEQPLCRGLWLQEASLWGGPACTWGHPQACPGLPSPSLLPKEGVCLPCPLLLQPHRSLNPELSERPPDSPGPHLISLGTQLNLSKAIGEEFILSP